VEKDASSKANYTILSSLVRFALFLCNSSQEAAKEQKPFGTAGSKSNDAFGVTALQFKTFRINTIAAAFPNAL
jgi:hypothetical protein